MAKFKCTDHAPQKDNAVSEASRLSFPISTLAKGGEFHSDARR